MLTILTTKYITDLIMEFLNSVFKKVKQKTIQI